MLNFAHSIFLVARKNVEIVIIKDKVNISYTCSINKRHILQTSSCILFLLSIRIYEIHFPVMHMHLYHVSELPDLKHEEFNLLPPFLSLSSLSSLKFLTSFALCMHAF